MSARKACSCLQPEFFPDLGGGVARSAGVAGTRFEQIEIIAQIIHLLSQAGKLFHQSNSRSRPADFLCGANHKLSFDV